MTEAERRLWRQLRLRQMDGAKFRRQYPVATFIVDFVCLDARLVIEVDGGQHADDAAYDAPRDARLRLQGFEVLRFWNKEVMANIEGVAEAILKVIKERRPHPNLPPQPPSLPFPRKRGKGENP